MIVEDKCLNRRTDITTELIKNRFSIQVDPSGLCRYPLQVAIDYQSIKCYNLMIGMIHDLDFFIFTNSATYSSLLEVKDERGWRAVEHALKYWPNVALNTLPFHTFLVFDEDKIRELIVFAMNNNLFPCIYFLRSLYSKWPADSAAEAKTFVLTTILEVFLDLEDCDSDAAVLFFKQVMQDLDPVILYASLLTEYQGKLKASILELYTKAIARRCTCFLSSPKLYSLIIDEFLGLVEKAFDDQQPVVFKSLVEAKAEFFVMNEHMEGIETWYNEIRNFIKDKVPILDYSPANTTGMSPEEINDKFSFYQAVTVFLNSNFIPNDELRGLVVAQNMSAMRKLTRPHIIYGKIPFIFLAALSKPEAIPLVYTSSKTIDYFDEIITVGHGVDLSAIKILACYFPKVFRSIVIKDVHQMKDILRYVLSPECRAPNEYKKETVMNLTKSHDKVEIVREFVDQSTSWDIFSKMFYENGLDVLAIIRQLLIVNNYHFAYKLAMMKRPSLDLDDLSQFVTTSEMEYVYDLMDLVDLDTQNLNSVKVLHDLLLNVLNELHKLDKESKLIGIIITRLWKHSSFDINGKVQVIVTGTIEEISVFKLLLSIDNENLLKKMIQVFPKGVLEISKDDKTFAESLVTTSTTFKYRFYADIARDYCNEP